MIIKTNMSLTKSLTTKVLIINASFIIIICAIAELSLRQIFPEKSGKESIYLFNKELPRIQPNLEHYIDRLGTTAGFNEDGSRRKTLDNEGTLSIGLFGDSNIAALFTSDEDAPNNVLANELRKRQISATVSSYGVGGFGPDQSLFKLKQVLVSGENFDHVILHVFADNDAGDFIRNNYEIKDGGLTNDGYCYPTYSW